MPETRPVTVHLTEEEIHFIDMQVRDSQLSGEHKPLTSRSEAIRRLVGRERLLKAMAAQAEKEA